MLWALYAVILLQLAEVFPRELKLHVLCCFNQYNYCLINRRWEHILTINLKQMNILNTVFHIAWLFNFESNCVCMCTVQFLFAVQVKWGLSVCELCFLAGKTSYMCCLLPMIRVLVQFSASLHSATLPPLSFSPQSPSGSSTLCTVFWTSLTLGYLNLIKCVDRKYMCVRKNIVITNDSCCLVHITVLKHLTLSISEFYHTHLTVCHLCEPLQF